MVAGWIITLIVVIVLVILLAMIVGLYNRIIEYENRIENAWGQIDVQLKRRADLVPNLVDTVKGYAAHEKAAIDSVTNARAALMGAGTREARMEAEGFLEQALGKLFAIAEAYPDLKANTNFLSLQDELSHTENKVAYARQHYNDSVLGFNNAVTTFPGVLVAGPMGRSKRTMLEIPAGDRELPRVNFGG